MEGMKKMFNSYTRFERIGVSLKVCTVIEFNCKDYTKVEHALTFLFHVPSLTCVRMKGKGYWRAVWLLFPVWPSMSCFPHTSQTPAETGESKRGRERQTNRQ